MKLIYSQFTRQKQCSFANKYFVEERNFGFQYYFNNDRYITFCPNKPIVVQKP